MEQPNNPLHGKTLESIVLFLVEKYGWEKLGDDLNMNCFKNEPSGKSCLKFLRKTPWAREKVEGYYLETISREYK
jgi:uncharacterized protein (DUF2132 family)